jgi:membrane carboxypeptidase/penicillin-binding protein PbpC
MGTQSFYAMLKSLEFNHLESGPDQYGPGVVLGSAGVTLLDLTRAYSIFTAKGELLPLRTASDPQTGDPLYYGHRRRIISKEAAYMITDILSDRTMRRKAFGKRSFLDFPFKVAAKTGTSKDYRDAWTIGYTDRYIVGVWAGNFSNESMNGVSGSYGAGRIFHQIMRHLHSTSQDGLGRMKFSIITEKDSSIFEYPADWKKTEICKDRGCIAGKSGCNINTEYLPPEDESPPLCENMNHDSSGNSTERKKSSYFLSPANGERFLINPHIPGSAQHIPIQISVSPDDRVILKLNDRIISERKGSYEMSVPASPGKYKLLIIVNGQDSETVNFSVGN